MATVRSDRVELVVDGRLTRMSARSGGPLTLATLARYLPDDWLSIQGGEALLNATVVLSRGTTLQIDDLYALRLTGGPTLSDASSIYTGSGRLIVRGAIVSSVDLHTRQPMPPNAAGRPFIEVNSRGYFEAVDATLTDLGTPAAAGNDGNAGVRFNADSTGSLVRTALQRGTTGLVLSRARDVRLEAVTVSDSAADGLVLHGDRGTALTGVRAEGNRGNGVLVGGESTDRALTGLSTSGNGLFGLAVVGQRGTRISGVTTSSDRAGGLRLSRSADVVVTDFTATDQPMGVFTHVHSTGIVIDRMRATGGRRAVVIEKSTEGIEVKAATIEGVRVAGVAAGGKVVQLTDLQVVDSKAGVRVERGAADVQITGLRVSGGQDGIVAAAGTSGVVVSDLTAEHVGADAVRTASTGTRVVGGRISGGSTGIDVAAATTITGTTIVAAQEGIRSRSPEPVRAETIAVDTTNLGVNVAAGSPFVLADSTVHALEAVRGPIVYQGANDVSLPPLNLLSAIGMPLVVLAVLLELGHAIRQHKTGGSTRRKPPPLVNAAGSTRPIKVQAAPARVPGPREPVPVDAWVHETSGSSPQQLGGGRELQEAGPRLGQQLAGGRVE
jgi:hypothetical protein